MKELHIAIAGAGISGLTAAIALAQKNYKVDLYEAAPAWAEIGAGITLAPNAMRGMDYIGVGKDIVDTGVEPSTQEISHWQTGNLILQVDRRETLRQYGSAYVYIHRADLHTILVKAAERSGVTIHLGKNVSEVSYSEKNASLHFDDGGVASADIVIGADGLKSKVRNIFAPLAPYFTGHVAYRAIAPASPEIQHLIDQPGMHIGPGKMVVRYPLRKGNLLNLVFFIRQSGWTEDGWSIPADQSELKETYNDWCEDVQTLVGAVKPNTVFKWAINAHKPLETWCYDGRVALLGDAAHAMTPFLGQGAATGIEDAVMLARAIESSNSTKEAFERYEAARYKRSTFIQLESNQNAERLQGQEAELYGVSNLRNEETLGLFSYDCANEVV